MTDLILAAVSAVGLLVYATLAVAAYKWRTRGKVSSYDPEWWERVGLALAILAVYGSVWATLALTTHRYHDWVSNWTMGWAIFAGFAAGIGVIATFVGTTPEVLHAFRAVFWPLSLPFGWLPRALVATVLFASRGPLRWGEALARLPQRRTDRKAAMERELAARAARIAELERELLSDVT